MLALGADMLWENLIVDRLVIHEVHKRRSDRKELPPTFGSELTDLGNEGAETFSERIISAIGSRSQSMEMTIKPVEPGSVVEVAQSMLGVSDTLFIDLSRRFAEKLARAQTALNLPGGLVVVFDGSVGDTPRRFVGVIKAETHGGFARIANLKARFVRDLFLTPQAKLYKLGIFVHDGNTAPGKLPDGWSATVFDSHMTTSNRDGAAQYFYEDYLGCELPSTSARLTRKFFEHTREFISKLEASPERKADYQSGLFTYLKVNQAKTIDVSSFATDYFEPELKNSYAAHMQRKEFPTGLVQKDISEIGNQLRRRRLTFSRNIQLTGPSEAFEELVEVKDVTVKVADEDGGTHDVAATLIVIRSPIQTEE